MTKHLAVALVASMRLVHGFWIPDVSGAASRRDGQLLVVTAVDNEYNAVASTLERGRSQEIGGRQIQRSPRHRMAGEEDSLDPTPPSAWRVPSVTT